MVLDALRGVYSQFPTGTKIVPFL